MTDDSGSYGGGKITSEGMGGVVIFRFWTSRYHTTVYPRQALSPAISPHQSPTVSPIPVRGVDSVVGISQVSSMTIKEARKLLGNEATNLSDEQIERYIFDCTAIADIIIESYISLPPAERAKYKTQINQPSTPINAQEISIEPLKYQL